MRRLYMMVAGILGGLFILMTMVQHIGAPSGSGAAQPVGNGKPIDTGSLPASEVARRLEAGDGSAPPPPPPIVPAAPVAQASNAPPPAPPPIRQEEPQAAASYTGVAPEPTIKFDEPQSGQPVTAAAPSGVEQ